MEKELIFHNQKFESEVRRALSIKDRPIYTSDALKVFELDLSEVHFDVEDCDNLCQFENLESLYISFDFEDISFFVYIFLLSCGLMLFPQITLFPIHFT